MRNARNKGNQTKGFLIAVTTDLETQVRDFNLESVIGKIPGVMEVEVTEMGILEDEPTPIKGT